MSNSLDRWFNKHPLSPFLEFSRAQDSFDRFFKEFVEIKRNGPKDLALNPSCEVTEENNRYVMRFDLPGVKKEQVKIEINRDQLTVSAERREEKKNEDGKKHFSEIYYGVYFRTFTLPSPIEEKNVSAKFENGVLTVTVPKTVVTPESKQIQIT